ncbi:BspA family leucine-rich repeat surface protein [Mycoplasma leachii]|nr:BspA family leucine-rich repeat surface protein [Mycoplasma leachii]
MKKLLTILGSTSLLVLPTFSVLSCTNSYWTKAEEYTPDFFYGQEVKYLQKAMYNNDECVQIGFFENSDGKIQIVPFKPTTTKVPSTLPSQITSLKEAFKGLKTSSVDGIEKWDTSKITDMTSVFDTTDEFNQDISKWNTSEVTNMSFMFTRAKKFDQNLNDWKTNKVTSMINTFQNAKEFNGNIGNWKTDSVTSMKNMFTQAVLFNQNISNWNTSKVIDMAYMFEGAEKFNQDISKWNIQAVENFNGMLRRAKEFDQDLSKWKFKKEIESNKKYEFAKDTKIEKEENKKLPTWKQIVSK